MNYCDKCGGVVRDLNKECPTCGMMVNPSIKNNISNNKSFNILIVVVVLIGLVISCVFFIKNIKLNNQEIHFSGKNYWLNYDGENWIKSDLSDSKFFVLQNTNDLNAYLQLPVSAIELNMDVSNEEVREELYNSYVYLLKKDKDYNYNNIMSSFVSLNNNNVYYLSSDFYKYDDDSLRGKLFIVLFSDGKAINILLRKGMKSVDSIEDDVYEVIKNIKI